MLYASFWESKLQAVFWSITFQYLTKQGKNTAKNALFGAGFFQKSQKQRLSMEIWMISVQIKYIIT